MIDRWRLDYNHHRIRSSLYDQTPAVDAAGRALPASATFQPPEHSRFSKPQSSHSTWFKDRGGSQLIETENCEQNMSAAFIGGQIRAANGLLKFAEMTNAVVLPFICTSTGLLS